MNRPTHSVIQYAGLMKFSVLLWKKALKRLAFLTQKINSIDGLFFFSKRLNSQSLVPTFAYWLANFPEHFDLLIRFAVFSVTGSMTHVLFSPPRVWELVKIPFYNESLIVKALWIIVPLQLFFFLEYTQLIFGLEAESYFKAYARSLHCYSTCICLSIVHLLALIVAYCGNMSIKMFLSIAISTNIHVYMLIFISLRYLSVVFIVLLEVAWFPLHRWLNQWRAITIKNCKKGKKCSGSLENRSLHLSSEGKKWKHLNPSVRNRRGLGCAHHLERRGLLCCHQTSAGCSILWPHPAWCSVSLVPIIPCISSEKTVLHLFQILSFFFFFNTVASCIVITC